jgi:hypothetical protein
MKPAKTGNQIDAPSLVSAQSPVVCSTSLIADYLDTPFGKVSVRLIFREFSDAMELLCPPPTHL